MRSQGDLQVSGLAVLAAVQQALAESALDGAIRLIAPGAFERVCVVHVAGGVG